MTNCQKFKDWVQEITEMCQPDSVYWCDGSRKEYDAMVTECIDGGYATPLNPNKRTGSLLSLSDVSDVAGVEYLYPFRKRGCIREYYEKFGNRLPNELLEQLAELEKRLNA